MPEQNSGYIDRWLEIYTVYPYMVEEWMSWLDSAIRDRESQAPDGYRGRHREQQS